MTHRIGGLPVSSIDDQLRIGHLSTLYHTSLLLMSPEWAGTPVAAEWELFATGPTMMKAFKDGRLDVGYIGLPPAMIGMAEGVPIRCIAGGHMEGTVLIGPPKANSLRDAGGSLSPTLAQFRGKAVGSPTEGSIHDVILRDLLGGEGLAEEVEVKNYTWADFLPDALADGDIAAAVGTPALAVAGKRWAGSKLLIPPSQLWPHNPSYGIVARREVIEETPTRLETFLQAHEEATALIRIQPDVAAAITARLVFIVDERFVLDTYRISPKYCAALPTSFVEATMDFVPTLRKLGYLNRALTQEEIFDVRFLTRIHPGAPHYEKAGALVS